jgi:hypothetical protein
MMIVDLVDHLRHITVNEAINKNNPMNGANKPRKTRYKKHPSTRRSLILAYPVPY